MVLRDRCGDGFGAQAEPLWLLQCAGSAVTGDVTGGVTVTVTRAHGRVGEVITPLGSRRPAESLVPLPGLGRSVLSSESCEVKT